MPLRIVRRRGSRNLYMRGAVRGQGVFESTGTPDQARARAVADAREADLWNRGVLGPRATATFAEAVVAYAAGRRLSAGHAATCRRLLDHFGRLRLAAIDQDAVDRYVSAHHAGAAPATVLRAVVTPMTSIMRSAARRGWCDAPRFERPRPPRGRLRYLTRDEAGCLLEASAPHLRPLLEFLLYTGARLGEALALDWRDVDLAGRRVAFLDTKNGESRGVPLSEPAFLALANLPHRDGAVFRAPHGGPYHDRRGLGGSPIKRAFKGAVRRAGIEPVRVHDLRHTFASWAVMAGVPLRTLADLLGHKTLAMVMRYSHLSPEHLRTAVDLVAGAESVHVPGAERAKR